MQIIWDPSLIVLSVLIAIAGSFTALTHAERMRQSKGRTATIWMMAGGSTLGMAIWSMHFVGMLAFQLPIPIGYDPLLTLFSLVPAIIAALLGFRVLRETHISSRRILLSGVLMGIGIGVMHYLGMAALEMSPPIEYSPWVVVLSVAIAIVASWAALLIMYRQDWCKLSVLARSSLGAVMMGAAISAMHYTAMQGLHIPENALCLAGTLRIEPHIMAAMLTMMSMIWFGGGLLASLFDQRMARNNAVELSNLEQEHRLLRERSDKVSESMIAALRESEDRLRTTLQNAPDAVFITEQDGRITYVNDNVVTLLGYERAELYSMSVYDLVPEDWRQGYRQGAKQILITQQRQVMEIRLVTKSGIRIPMELNAVLMPDGRVYGSCRDIRERKAAEKAIRDSQAHLQRMMDSIAEGMYGVDMQGNCTFVNAAFLRILGYEHADEVLGKCIHTLIHHSHADGTHYPEKECLMYQSFGLQQPAHVDTEVFWRKDGVAVPVEYWSHPIIQEGVVIGAVATFLDITRRKEKEEYIHQLAFYDPLTQLPNRRLLFDRLRQALLASARNARNGALMFLDLDHFKSLNDTKGHEVGDQLLMEVAKRLQACVRDGDTVARIGGDEFVVVLEALSEDGAEAASQAEAVAEKIRTSLSQTYQLDNHLIHTSTSIGIVPFAGSQSSVEDLLRHADTAMYRAKDAGRNVIRFFDQAMQTAIESRVALEADLHQALARGQLELFYQVQVGVNSKALGAEVLLRWQHHELGLVFPEQFIWLAEKNGLIIAIGEWVLDEVCAQIRRWQNDVLFRHIVLGVNISTKQMRHPGFVDQVKQAVLRHGIHPNLLKLEITESLMLENVEDTISKMTQLKDFGVKFSLDDFGTGYSSLAYLKQLPLDQLKIDQAFVRNITSDTADRVMVMALVDLAMNFELNVVAEGVETEEQFNLLRRLGCNMFQGYLFSRPVPIGEFGRQVRDRQQ
ncbi:MAG: EAL domain-containing protein [Gallionella sp.]|nr:EAL domain-containing protein [Gallionella sp.]